MFVTLTISFDTPPFLIISLSHSYSRSHCGASSGPALCWPPANGNPIMCTGLYTLAENPLYVSDLSKYCFDAIVFEIIKIIFNKKFILLIQDETCRLDKNFSHQTQVQPSHMHHCKIDRFLTSLEWKLLPEELGIWKVIVKQRWWPECRLCANRRQSGLPYRDCWCPVYKLSLKSYIAGSKGETWETFTS